MAELQPSKGEDKLLVSISGNWSVWQSINEQFAQNNYLPFSGFLWKSNQQDNEEVLNITKLQADFLEETSPLFDPLAEPLNWWRKPFLYIFIFEYDAHKDHQQDLISRLRQWITRRLAVSGECLLLCTNKEELNGSKGSGSVSLRFVSPTSAQASARKFIEKLRSELKLGDQIVKISSGAGFAEQNSDDLQSAFNKIRDSLVNSAVSRIKEYKLLIQTQHSTDIYRQLVIRESIALIYLAMGVREEALKQYQECEDDLGLSSSDGEDHVPQALRVYKYDFEGSDLENPLDRSHRPYRLLISQGDISLHSLQLYFLGRDVELNLAMSQPFIAGERAVKLVRRILQQSLSPWTKLRPSGDRLKESCLSPLFIASLAINVCLHMASTFLALQTDGVINPAYQSKEKQLNCIISEFFLIARQYSMGVLKILQDLDFDGMENAEEEASTPSQDSPLLDDFPHVLFASHAPSSELDEENQTVSRKGRGIERIVLQQDEASVMSPKGSSLPFLHRLHFSPKMTRNGYFTRGSTLLNTLHPSLRRRTPKATSSLHVEGKEGEGSVTSPLHQSDSVDIETSVFEAVLSISLSLDEFRSMLNPRDSRKRISGRLLAALCRRGGVAELCHELTGASCAFLERAGRPRTCTILQYQTALSMRRSSKWDVASLLLRRCLLFIIMDNWNFLVPLIYNELCECLRELQMVKLETSLHLVLLGAKGIPMENRMRAEEELLRLPRGSVGLEDVAFSSDSLLSAHLVQVENCKSSPLSDTQDLLPPSSSRKEELNDVVTLDLGDGLIVTSKRVWDEEAEEVELAQFGKMSTREESDKSMLFEVALGQEFNLDVEVSNGALCPHVADEIFAVMEIIQDEYHSEAEPVPPSSSSSPSLLLPDVNRPTSVLFEDMDGLNINLPLGSMVFPMLRREQGTTVACFRSQGAVALRGGKNRVTLTGCFHAEGCYRISCFVFLLGPLRLAHKYLGNEIFFVRLFPPPPDLSVWTSGSITTGHEPIVRLQVAAKKMDVARSQLTVELPDQLSLCSSCLVSVFEEVPEEEEADAQRFNELCAESGKEERWGVGRTIEVPPLRAGQAAIVLFGIKVEDGKEQACSPSASSGRSSTMTVRLSSSVEKNRFFRIERELVLVREDAFTVTSRLQWRSEEEKMLLLQVRSNIPIHSCCLLSHRLLVRESLRASPASRHCAQRVCMFRGDVVSLVYSISRDGRDEGEEEEAQASLEMNVEVLEQEDGIYEKLHGRKERRQFAWLTTVAMGGWDRPSIRYSFTAGQTCVFGEPHEVELYLEISWGRPELGRELLCELLARDGSWFLIGRTKFRVTVPVRREENSPPPTRSFKFRLLPLYCGNLSLPVLVVANVPAASLLNTSSSSTVHVLPREGTRVTCELFPVPAEASDGGKLQLRRKEKGGT